MEHIQQFQDQEFSGKAALGPFLKRLFGYAIGHRRVFWVFVASVVLVGITDALFPLIWMYFLDDAITPAVNQYLQAQKQGINPSVTYSKLLFYVGLFFANSVVQVIGVYFFIKKAGFMEETVMYQLRKQMFARLQELSFSFYDKQASGWLLSRITSDAQRVTELISWGFLEVVWGITMIIACMGAMFFYNWQLALIVLVSLPVLFVVSIKIRMLILDYSRKARKLNSELTANYAEHINGIEVNKITTQEDRVSKEFTDVSNKMRNASYKAAYYTAMYYPMVVLIGSTAAAAVLLVGAKMALAVPVGITIGTLSAFFNYATFIFFPIMDISRFYALAQGSLSAGERIFSLIDEKPTIQDQPNAGAFPEIKGEIVFNNVGFYYHPDKPVLQNLHLHIKAGQSIALVGPTGHGKSTIANLICRFYEPTSGVIYIDGLDYTAQTQQSLHSQLGVVLQTPHLFEGTVRDNVRYARPNATDETVINALMLVGGEAFTSRLDEKVESSGDNLSMGERQIISFARALITNPRILIMDEATSSVDTLTEARIQSGIEHMIKGRTSVIIAHRLSTIKHCDRILVIQNGTITEDGNHTQLMKQRGHYYRLYTKQLKKEIATQHWQEQAEEEEVIG
ncbi:MAG TPA: ABC transporter ATP-binding protein [Chitinophagales bacterium]|nr:ABC transporter ATP-binding protein [Chitinophagales bacterium]HRK28944.1 ABC transporter ATP-binding protein [Chitinophagales bacterium]